MKFYKVGFVLCFSCFGLNLLTFSGIQKQALASELSLIAGLEHTVFSSASTSSNVGVIGRIENAFSPGAGAEDLVLKVIASAKSTIRLAAYSFTSPKVVSALLQAKKRGVDVQVVLDDKGNRSKASISAMNILLGADIAVRTNSRFAIHHDKYVIVDEIHVQTGSFNYSKAAAKSNSENVLVVWGNADLAYSYLKHWRNRYEQGRVAQLSY
jgi:phosphatidylserine/phosphatidylglycerophosphate/cardiolipin synthase-like enzyme